MQVIEDADDHRVGRHVLHPRRKPGRAAHHGKRQLARTGADRIDADHVPAGAHDFPVVDGHNLDEQQLVTVEAADLGSRDRLSLYKCEKH